MCGKDPAGPWLKRGNDARRGGDTRRPLDRRQGGGRWGVGKVRSHLVPRHLRPVNTRGMGAPRNTNQFLMREKYKLMHLRSDSVGTDSGSDGESEQGNKAHVEERAVLEAQEDSMQYFPSENDVMQSEDFMQRDFVQFCEEVNPCVDGPVTQ